MIISTNTASCMTSYGTERLLTYEEAIEKLHRAGFRNVDISFVFHEHPDFILKADDWEERIEKLKEAARNLGVTFNQCHFPFTRTWMPFFKEEAYYNNFMECTKRAIVAAGKLGVKCGVMHPMTFPEYNHEQKKCLEQNLLFYDPLVDLAVKNNVCIAIENMPPAQDNENIVVRYCQHYDQLIELVDSFHDTRVGICWDTGHANLNHFNQTRALEAVGKRLKAVHLNDNHKNKWDEHLVPYLGDINWQEIMAALVAIAYEGDLTYESGQVGKHALTGSFQDLLLKMTYENASAMLELYHKELKKDTFLNGN